MKTFLVTLTIFFAFVLCGFQNARACSCMLRMTCEFSATAAAVFVGRIVESKVEERLYRYSDNPSELPVKAKFQVSRVDISEAFFGTADKKEIVIETDNFSSCFFSLEKGVEYIIYANADEKTGRFSTGFCSGTKPVQAGGEDLQFLRAQKNTNGATVKGFVAFNSKNREYLLSVPPDNSAALFKAGISTVLLENEREKLTAKIENDGAYILNGVPKGKYKLSVLLPKGYEARYSYNPIIARELGIELGAVELNGYGCRIENLTIVRPAVKRKRVK
jgi:hypothetical protein